MRRRRNPAPVLIAPALGALAVYFLARHQGARSCSRVSRGGKRVYPMWLPERASAEGIAMLHGGCVAIYRRATSDLENPDVFRIAQENAQGAPVVLVRGWATAGCVAEDGFRPAFEAHVLDRSGRLRWWGCLPSESCVRESYVRQVLQTATRKHKEFTQ